MEVRFTKHIKDRMKRRQISEEEIISAIKNSNKTSKIGKKFYAQKDIGRAKIEVVYEKDKYINIVTAYYI